MRAVPTLKHQRPQRSSAASHSSSNSSFPGNEFIYFFLFFTEAAINTFFPHFSLPFIFPPPLLPAAAAAWNSTGSHDSEAAVRGMIFIALVMVLLPPITLQPNLLTKYFLAPLLRDLSLIRSELSKRVLQGSQITAKEECPPLSLLSPCSNSWLSVTDQEMHGCPPFHDALPAISVITHWGRRGKESSPVSHSKTLQFSTSTDNSH